MEETASGNAEVLLAKMRALARRGASLRQAPDGTGTIEQSDRRRRAEPITPPEFLGMLDAGWLRQSGHGCFVISRRGASALRSLLSRPRSTEPAPLSSPVRRAATTSQPRGKEYAGPGDLPRTNLKESPLAWLRQRRDKDGKPMISATELDAGERLRADFDRAHLNPRVTASWNPAAVPSGQARGAPGVGLDPADSVIMAKQRVELALKAVGPELAGMLVDVCCFLQGIEQAERNGGWPRRAGKVVLQLGLAHLARHYGLDQRQATGPGRIRSWGGAGYRPRVDGDDTDGDEDQRG